MFHERVMEVSRKPQKAHEGIRTVHVGLSWKKRNAVNVKVSQSSHLPMNVPWQSHGSAM